MHNDGESGCTVMGRMDIQWGREWIHSDGERGCAVIGRVDVQ